MNQQNENVMQTQFEVIIIGGSYSGLSAAMALGRASRKTLVIDSGKPCNRDTPHSHNFITRDGETPSSIAKTAREQVACYPSVSFLNDIAVSVQKIHESFEVTTETGTKYRAKKLLFATGITDILPPIKGLQECWAKTVIHCPYCHGYEVKGVKTAILANGEAAIHYSKLLLQWTKQLTIFTNSKADFTTEQAEKLSSHNITVIEPELEELTHSNGQLQNITLKDGSKHSYPVMYYKPQFKMHCDIPVQLGAKLNELGFIHVDFSQMTTINGVYAAGDCTSPFRSVANAVAEGSKAGAMINNQLATEAF